VKQDPQFPEMAGGKITSVTKQQIRAANEKFGATESAIVRMALESFLPGYLAAQGRPENVEFFAQVSAALNESPTLRSDIEQLLRSKMRKSSRRAA